MRITVTFKHLVQKCREAYDNKHLAAQNPEVTGRECRYFYYGEFDWCHCAIGAGLPPELRTDFLSNWDTNDSSISGAAFRNKVQIEATRTERARLIDLQTAHDRWLQDGDDCKPKFDRALAACEARIAQIP